MTLKEISDCYISLELARNIANQINCLTDEDNANIDKVAALLAAQIAKKVVKETYDKDENKE